MSLNSELLNSSNIFLLFPSKVPSFLGTASKTVTKFTLASSYIDFYTAFWIKDALIEFTFVAHARRVWWVGRARTWLLLGFIHTMNFHFVSLLLFRELWDWIQTKLVSMHCAPSINLPFCSWAFLQIAMANLLSSKPLCWTQKGATHCCIHLNKSDYSSCFPCAQVSQVAEMTLKLHLCLLMTKIKHYYRRRRQFCVGLCWLLTSQLRQDDSQTLNARSAPTVAHPLPSLGFSLVSPLTGLHF